MFNFGYIASCVSHGRSGAPASLYSTYLKNLVLDDDKKLLTRVESFSEQNISTLSQRLKKTTEEGVEMTLIYLFPKNYFSLFYHYDLSKAGK